MWKKVSNTTAAIKTMQESNGGGSGGDAGENGGEKLDTAQGETGTEAGTLTGADAPVGEVAKDIAIVVTKCSDEGGSSGPDGPKTKVIFPSQDSTDTGNEAHNLNSDQKNNNNNNNKLSRAIGKEEGAGSGSPRGAGTLTTTESTGEEEAAPFNTILDFLSSLLTKNYKEALRLSKNILKYEPQNKTVAEFLNVLEEVVAGGLLEDTSDSSSSSTSSSESDSSGSSGSSSSSSSDSDSSDSESEDGENELVGMECSGGGGGGIRHNKQFGIEDLESILTATTCSCKKGRHHHRHGQRGGCSGRRISSANTICTTITNNSSTSSTSSSKSSSSSDSTTTTGRSAATTATSCGMTLLRNVESRLNTPQIRRCLLASPSSENADAVMRRALWAVAEASTLESTTTCCEEKFHHGVVTGSPERLLHDCNDCLSSVSTPDTFLVVPAGGYCLSREASSESSTSTDCCPRAHHQNPVHPLHDFNPACNPPRDFHEGHSQAGGRGAHAASATYYQSQVGEGGCQVLSQGCHSKGRGSQGYGGGAGRCGVREESQCNAPRHHHSHVVPGSYCRNSPQFQTPPPITPSSPLKSILKTSNNSGNCYQHKHKFYPDEVRFDDSLLPNTASSSSSSSSCSEETTDDGYSS